MGINKNGIDDTLKRMEQHTFHKQRFGWEQEGRCHHFMHLRNTEKITQDLNKKEIKTGSESVSGEILASDQPCKLATSQSFLILKWKW